MATRTILTLAIAGALAFPAAVAAQGYTGGYGYQNGQNGQNNGGIGNGAGYGGNGGGGIGNGAGYGGNGGGNGNNGGIGNGAGWNGGRPGGQARQVVCESWQFRPQMCPADTSGGVRLLQQTGGTCIQGQSWGFNRQGIWVNNGCRAVFAAVGGRPNYGGGGGFPPAQNGGGRMIQCESWQFQPQRCATDVYGRPGIDVIAGNCIQGQTWGWDRGGIWVNGGCRARFRLG